MLQTHNTRTEDAQHDKRRYPTGQRRLSVERHLLAARPLAPLPVAVRPFTPPVAAAGRPPVETARATRAIHLVRPLARVVLARRLPRARALGLEARIRILQGWSG